MHLHVRSKVIFKIKEINFPFQFVRNTRQAKKFFAFISSFDLGRLEKRKGKNFQVEVFTFDKRKGIDFTVRRIVLSHFLLHPLSISLALPFSLKRYEAWAANVYWQFTLAPTDPATSRSLVLNSRGRQLHILCWSLRASRHLAAPSIASIWHSRSPVAAAEPIALSYCRNAFCNMSIFISPMLSLWRTDRRARCMN